MTRHMATSGPHVAPGSSWIAGFERLCVFPWIGSMLVPGMFDEAFKRFIGDAVRDGVRAALREARRTLSGDHQLSADRMMSLTDAGAEFGYSANTIRDWVKQRKVPGYGRGRGLRVKRSELVSFLSKPPMNESSDADLDERASAIARRRR